MALPKPLHKDHHILGEENYCPGYVDAYGNWNNGFPCPILAANDPPIYCCGTATQKYCCTGAQDSTTAPVNTVANTSIDDVIITSEWYTRLPLLLGVLVGAVVALTVVVVVSCLHCSCCLLYKKRQPSNTGPVYQVRGGTPSVSGMANMYSFSRATTPHCTISRSSSTRSVSSSNSNRHSLVSLRVPLDPPYISMGTVPRYNPMQHHNAARSDCSSMISSLSSGVPPSDSSHRAPLLLSSPPVDMPPPYSPIAPSSMVAVRTSLSSGGTSTLRNNSTTTTMSRLPPPVRDDVYGVDDSITSGLLSTFSHTGSVLPSTSLTQTLRSRYDGSNSFPLTPRTEEMTDENPFLRLSHRSYIGAANRSSGLYSPSANLDDNLNVNTNPHFYSIANDPNLNLYRTLHHTNHDEERESSSPATDEAASSSSGLAKDLSLPLLPSTPKNLHYLHDADGEAYKGESGAPTRSFLGGHKGGYGSPVAVAPFSPALTPTTRPCSTAHIVNTGPDAEEPENHSKKLFTATKF